MKKRLLVGIFVFLLSLNLICAGYSLGNSSHDFAEVYSLGGSLVGWINMSFSSENGDNLLTDAIGGEVSLLDLMKSNVGLDYECSTLSCSPDYSYTNPETNKTLDISEGQKEEIGLVLTGDISNINSLEFNYTTNAGESCSPQFIVEMFGGKFNFTNNNETDTLCSATKNFGCYDSGETQTNLVVQDKMYCQKINLSTSPKFSVGALITPGDLNDDIKFYIRTLDFDEVGSCTNGSFSAGEQYITCNIDYSNGDRGEYFVCVDSKSDSTHTLKGHSSEDDCGFFDDIDAGESYAIYAEGYKFGVIESLKLEDDFPTGDDTFSEMIKDYINEVYGSLSDCEAGCVIPIKIQSMKDQEITFQDLKLNYEKPSPRIESNFYDILSSSTKITSDYQIILLDNSGLTVDDETGNYSLVLSFDGDEIVSETLNILDIPSPKSIYPEKTISAYNTEFTVKVEPDANISQTIWVFDTNTTKTSSNKKTTYAFSTLGNHTVNVTVVDKGGRRTSKVFTISVESPREFIEAKIEENKDNYEIINNKIKNYSLFIQTVLESELNLTGMNDRLKALETNLSLATTNSEYNALMGELEKIRIPADLEETLTLENIPYSPTKEKIDLSIVKAISGENISSSKETGYKESIVGWMQKNYKSRLTYLEYSAKFNGDREKVASIFTLKVTKEGNSEGTDYFVIKANPRFKFDKSYSEKDLQGYKYFEIGTGKTISFSDSSVDYTSLGAFILPELSRLAVIDEGDLAPEQSSSRFWIFFILALILIFIMGSVIYLVMQQWYKNKYESYLFKNKNSLYNLLNYVENQKKEGKKEGEMRTKLRKAGWSSEQIDYVVKKYYGKKTGLFFEVPVEKILGLLKKKGVVDKKPAPKKVNPATMQKDMVNNTNLNKLKK